MTKERIRYSTKVFRRQPGLITDAKDRRRYNVTTTLDGVGTLILLTSFPASLFLYRKMSKGNTGKYMA